jgi:hypothetical protein
LITDKEHNNNLPQDFHRYFWDVSFEELTLEKYPRYIAERILNYGDLHAVKWLLSWIDKKFLRTIIESSRNLNSKTRNYWQILLTDGPD